MDVISWQHSHIREDTLLNMLLLSALHAHCDSGPAWADLTPAGISDRNRSHLEQVVFSYYKDYRCQSVKEQQRQREVGHQQGRAGAYVQVCPASASAPEQAMPLSALAAS